jgi:two-component system, sensor histidine kinase
VELRVLVWAAGRDGSLTCGFLKQAGVDSLACTNWSEFRREIERGAGVLIVGDEMLSETVVEELESVLGSQPPWSDIPIIVVASRSNAKHKFETLGTVSVLYRPVSPDTLSSTVRVALRARRRQYQVRDLLRQREDFLAMLAHELRNPLAPIRTGLQVLRLVDSRVTADQVTAMIERQVAMMSRLIDDLLDVSRITRGRISLKKELVNLQELLRMAADGHRRLAAEKGIKIRCDAPSEPLLIQADATRLEQMIGNVMANAIKFTPERGEVTLSAARERELAVIRVRDTGIGIPPAMLSKIFDPFTQSERPLDRGQGGLGIGLTLVKSLAELHGGSVEALSEGEGHGTEIVMRLPAGPPAGYTQAAMADSGSFRRQSLRKVLLVEDNRDAATALAAYLQACGHTVHIAHDGTAGMRAALQMQPEVVICDIGLPGVDGYELARILRSEPRLKSCLLVAVTGYGEDRDRERGFKAGFHHYLVKPADPATIAEIVASEGVLEDDRSDRV